MKYRSCISSTLLFLGFLTLSFEPPWTTIYGGTSSPGAVVVVTAFVVPRLPTTPSSRLSHKAYQQQQGRWIRSTALQAAENISGEEVRKRLEAQLKKLREKDRSSAALSPEEVDVVYEDDDIIVVNKPNGILCVPSEDGVNSLVEAVYNKCKGSDTLRVAKFNQMVVHRLGMDTSGLIVLAKTMAANRGMNALFRTRKITRQYECLVAGHVEKDQGLINFPLMRDYEHPPFMRVSSEEHQKVLANFDPQVVGKKLLEGPKDSVTHYQVVSREHLNGKEDLPVSRLTLTSVTGRTHQLNVHCAAFGHPIVGDTVYAWNGDAAPNGGLDHDTLAAAAPDFASVDLQKAIASAATSSKLKTCVHAKSIRFRHPVTGEDIECTSKPPF